MPSLSRPPANTRTRMPARCPLLVLVGLVAFVALTRLLPNHTPNVTAVAATALFAGWFFRNRLLAIAAPVGAMLVSDSIIGGYHPLIMGVVYASLAAPILLRPLMGDGSSLRRLFGGAILGSLAASTLFFVTTNLAVWGFAGYYTRDLAGMGECFAAALPFFRFTAGGDLAFTLALYGGYVLIARTASLRSAHRAPVAA
jgi:hypothetical protein